MEGRVFRAGIKGRSKTDLIRSLFSYFPLFEVHPLHQDSSVQANLASLAFYLPCSLPIPFSSIQHLHTLIVLSHSYILLPKPGIAHHILPQCLRPKHSSPRLPQLFPYQSLRKASNIPHCHSQRLIVGPQSRHPSLAQALHLLLCHP